MAAKSATAIPAAKLARFEKLIAPTGDLRLRLPADERDAFTSRACAERLGTKKGGRRALEK